MSSSGATLAERIRKRQTALVRDLNDQHIFIQEALTVLEADHQARADSTDESERNYVVPSRKKKGVARRTDAEITRIYDTYLKRELFATSLIAAVSRTEAFIFDVLRMVLCEHAKKLGVSIQGNRAEFAVPLPAILKAKRLDDVINAAIDRRLNAASYAPPREYLAYFSEITGVNVQVTEFSTYIEIKATRDLLIHGLGVVNETYLDKVGTAKRASVAQLIPIDRTYYDQSIATLKKLAGLVSDGAWKAFSRGA